MNYYLVYCYYCIKKCFKGNLKSLIFFSSCIKTWFDKGWDFCPICKCEATLQDMVKLFIDFFLQDKRLIFTIILKVTKKKSFN